MVKVAFIFPGQGAQKVGMGKEFYENFSQAKAIFDEADKILHNGLIETIFNGPPEKLTQTAYCQPAILTFSIAALKAFEAHSKFRNISLQFTAGLSLGEYSALAAAGALSFSDALRLVERRSFFMEEATRTAKGAMAAIIGFDKEKLKAICSKTGAEVANFNSNEQIVITGHAEKVQAACALINQEGAKAVIPLDVSGAFHSLLMKPAAEKFARELVNVAIADSRILVISNVDGKPEIGAAVVKSNLAKQITSSVQWVASIEYMAGQGVETFIEIGPGRVLKGLLRKINPALKVFNIETPADIEALPL